eukprot:66448-Hanusia_phi.AAC.1
MGPRPRSQPGRTGILDHCIPLNFHTKRALVDKAHPHFMMPPVQKLVTPAEARDPRRAEDLPSSPGMSKLAQP